MVLSYTVLVRRYQNQGITLSNAPSSPSDCGTPVALSSYPDEEDYISFNPQIYDTISPSPSQTTERRSWTGFDNDAYSVWSSPQAYTLSTAITDQNSHHSSGAHPAYAYAQPPSLRSNMSSNWDGATQYMHHPSPLPHSDPPPNPTVYGYSAHPVGQQPPMSHDIGYTASTVQTSYAAMPNHSPPTSSQHGYQTNTMAMSRDPRHPHYPFYHS